VTLIDRMEDKYEVRNYWSGRVVANGYAEAPDALSAAVPHCPELRQERTFRA